MHIGTLGLTLIGRAGGNGAKPNLLARAPRVAPPLKHETKCSALEHRKGLVVPTPVLDAN